MQSRLVKRERVYVMGFTIDIPLSKQFQIKLNKEVMKQLVKLQRYLTLPPTEQIVALRTTHEDPDMQRWVIGYPVSHRFPTLKEYSYYDLPAGTYFVGTKGQKLEFVYEKMTTHWVLNEMYDTLPVLFECYTIAGNNKKIQVFSHVKLKVNEQQQYA